MIIGQLLANLLLDVELDEVIFHFFKKNTWPFLQKRLGNFSKKNAKLPQTSSRRLSLDKGGNFTKTN